jgi:type I restriction-modification system DNA methylase subunit
MAVPKKVSELIERFDRNLNAYKQGRYNETQLRLEFINPFFEELGWDITNKQGYAEAYKEVVHEDAIKVGGATKAPDYSFRIGGTRKFFLEAKKPSVDIKYDIHPAYQLRRYAWSAKLPLSILTDFEEFAVYDCRVKPVKTDKASHSRILYFTYTDYIKRWEEIAGIFSREAILKGSFDTYVESKKTKRGTAEVDTAFLQEIERWRDLLARNIALRNPNLSHRELNFSVQRTIDRIIFLRICEDRGIEFYGKLMALQNGTRIYQRLFQLFRQADDRYNSGLFHFRPEKERPEDSLDRLTPDLNIDDRVLKEILKNLYYPDSPYEFSVLPADILGQVYEQFLGKVIRLTPGHHAVVEDKPEVRKAGGVYYTPTYIVDYIVKQTVGKLVEGKKPGPRGAVSKLKILDPACGSGSFLLGAYQFLLNWHRDEYIKDDPEKWVTGRKPRLYQKDTGEWKLTTDERKRILLNNIYGVDIDPQAVEVTKLSLLLKVLEGEDEQTIFQQLVLFHQRVLPDLASNIKCGNSLIGPDFYQGQQMSLLNEEEMYRINAFDWNTEFPEIMNNGGFGAVIGNPPYVFSREQLSQAQRKYFSAKYSASWEKHNTFMLFMELMLRLLNKKGQGGFIVPNSWLTIESAHLLRGIFITHLNIIADLNYTVFDRVSMEPCIFIISGIELRDPVLALRADSKYKFTSQQLLQVARERWAKELDRRIVFSYGADLMSIIDKVIGMSKSIGEIFEVRSGLQAYERGKGNPLQTAEDVKNHIFDREKWENEQSFRYLQGRDVRRYHLNWSGKWLQYGPWLSQPREFEIFSRPRVLLREITSDIPYCLNATCLSDTYLNNKSILNVLHPEDDTEELKCFLGILNSRIMSLFYKQRAVKSARKIFPKVVIRNLRQFPYPNLSDSGKRSKLIQLVDRMQDLHKQLAEAKVAQAKTVLQRQIETTDRQIDELVYELYGLTNDEIEILEKSLE